MPSSAHALSPSNVTTPAVVAAATDVQVATTTHFGVVPFKRTADGAIVAGTAVPVTNGDIAWRFAQAAAWDHDNVGAVALTGADPASLGQITSGVLLASFGQVNLDALRH